MFCINFSNNNNKNNKNKKKKAMYLTFTTLWFFNSADDKLIIFFLILFWQKQALTSHTNCILIYMTWQNSFSGNNKVNISKCYLLNCLSSMLSLKVTMAEIQVNVETL